MKSAFLLLFTIFCSVANLSHSSDTQLSQQIFIQPEQIVFDKSGLFAELSGLIVKISSIHHDGQRLYALVDHYNPYECPFGHAAPDGDMRCRYPGCPFEKK